ncbi:hypothetical protein [Methylibium sp.]|uniref:hypothetical protein n=1 Tax=Methylibium sp. TaxID=2067992 RepID=UPI003BABE594
MTPPPNADLSIIAVAVLVASTMFGPEVAAVAGPYMVIFAGAVLGAFINTARHQQHSLSRDLITFGCVVAFVMLTTVTAADVLVHYTTMPPLVARNGLGLLAIAIGAIGEDWLRIARWFIDVRRRFFEAKASRDAGGHP